MRILSPNRTFSVSWSGCRDSVSGDGVLELKLSSVKSISDTSLVAERTPKSHGLSFSPRDAPGRFAPEAAASSPSA